MAGNDTNPIADRIRRPEGQTSGPGCDVHELLAAANGSAFDTKVMPHAIKLHRRELAERKSDKDLLDSCFEAVEIGMHESWF